MEPKDIRWLQRFANFQKALAQLTRFIEKGELNEFEAQGLIQCFEYTFELAWKTAKDYLEAEGYEVKTPRQTIQQSFQIDMITEGHMWLDALEKRNLMAHTYNEETAEEAVALIRDHYYEILQQLAHYLSQQMTTAKP